jgi:hypothetical protein
MQVVYIVLRESDTERENHVGFESTEELPSACMGLVRAAFEHDVRVRGWSRGRRDCKCS